MLVMQSSGIDGQVRDARTHREIPWAKVDVSSSGIPIDRRYSDRSGRFRFDQLQPGSFVLSVESVKGVGDIEGNLVVDLHFPY